MRAFVCARVPLCMCVHVSVCKIACRACITNITIIL